MFDLNKGCDPDFCFPDCPHNHIFDVEKETIKFQEKTKMTVDEWLDKWDKDLIPRNIRNYQLYFTVLMIKG